MTSTEFNHIENKIKKTLESEQKVKQVEAIFKQLVEKSKSGNLTGIVNTKTQLQALKAEAEEEINVENAVAIVEETTNENPIQGIDYTIGRITTFIQNNILSHQDFDIPPTRIKFLNYFGQLFDTISFDLLTIRFFFEKIKYGEEYEKEYNLEKEYKIDVEYLVQSNNYKTKYAKIIKIMHAKLKLLQSMNEDLMNKITDFLRESSSEKLSEYKITNFISPIIQEFTNFNQNLLNYKTNQ